VPGGARPRPGAGRRSTATRCLDCGARTPRCPACPAAPGGAPAPRRRRHRAPVTGGARWRSAGPAAQQQNRRGRAARGALWPALRAARRLPPAPLAELPGGKSKPIRSRICNATYYGRLHESPIANQQRAESTLHRRMRIAGAIRSVAKELADALYARVGPRATIAFRWTCNESGRRFSRRCSGSCPHSRRGITPSENPAQDAERHARVTTRTPGSLGAKRTKTTEVTQTQ